MRNFKLIIAYDGSPYRGWQKTKEGPSIEAELEKALFLLLGAPVVLQAASRTDAGVHAMGQTINFFAEKEIDPSKLNALLPPDIRALSMEAMPEKFHPTLDAQSKEYCYQIDNYPFQLPHRQKLAWHFIYPLDLAMMLSVKDALLGRQDFSALANRREEDNFCEIYSIDITEENRTFTITVRGKRFLYKMMRNIAGTLAYAGCGKLKDLALLIKTKDRRLMGPTAPAFGLTLKKIFYEKDNL